MGLRDAVRRLLGGGATPAPGAPSGPELAAARDCVDELVRLAAGGGGRPVRRPDAGVLLAAAQRLGPFPPPAFGAALLERLRVAVERVTFAEAATLIALILALRRHGSIGAFDDAQWGEVFSHWLRIRPRRDSYGSTWDGLRETVRRVEKAQGRGPLADRLRAHPAWRDLASAPDLTAASRRDLARLEAALGDRTSTRRLFDASDPFGALVARETDALPEAERAAWVALLEHAASLTASRPSGRWTEVARRCVAAVGEEAFEASVARWFECFPVAGDEPADPVSVPMVRGLVWASADLDPGRHAPRIADLAGRCWRKVPGFGPRSTAVGFAALEVLGRLPDLAGIPHLTRIRARLRAAGPRRRVEAVIAKAAEARGIRAEELEEIAAPTCGLGADGRREDVLGSFRSVVVPDGRGGVTWTWSGRDGRARKTVPADVARDHPAEVKSLQAEVREIPTMLRAQADRLERFFLEERRLKAEAWRDRYMEHPFLRHVARRLVWVVEGADGAREVAWADGALRTADDAAASAPPPEATVRLWHPVHAKAEVVAGWRRFLERHGITQPFKQAHREVYLLTPAEVATGTYSNRFAAHVLKQHQLSELARARGWSHRLQGQFDGDGTPVRDLPRQELQAQFLVEADTDHVTEAGIALYVRTDQVRFLTTAGEPQPLDRIPPLVLSEVMRDVDLFVGVASIGNDPTWVDQGVRPHAGYWRDFAFGDLSEVARTRRATLEALVPRLRIAARCSFTDRYLVVRGDLRTYKIHLGSGNILMEPNDAYLCIVAAPSRRDDPGPLYVPFEGDRVLALVVSKAILLADDARITDSSIRSQIRRG